MTSAYEIKGWAEFQHYKDRNPPWIKLHIAVLQSIDWVMTDDGTRLLMVVCMMLGSRTGGRIPNDARYIQRFGHLDAAPDLKPLVDMGWLVAVPASTSASTALARLDSDASTSASTKKRRGESEAEAEPEAEQSKDTVDAIASPVAEGLKLRKGNAQPEEHPSFAAFWAAYPSRGDGENPRKPSVVAFARAINRGADPEQLVKLAPKAAPLDQHGTRFVPRATTWLNEDRWNDAAARQQSVAGNPATVTSTAAQECPPDLTGWRRAAFEAVGAGKYRSWLEAAVESREGRTMTLAFPSVFMADFVRSHMSIEVNYAILQSDKAIADVKYVCASKRAVA